MNRAVDLILFDAVGTLIFPEPSAGIVYRDCARQMGLRIPDHVDYGVRLIGAMHQIAITLRHDRSEQTNEEFEFECWRQIVRGVFVESAPHDAELAFDALWRHFSLASNWQVFPDVAPTIAALKLRGYRIGIASNFDGRLLGICQELPALNQIDLLFISSQVGWCKGAVQFYEAIERTTQIPADRILMVGDDCHGDYIAPQSRGWQARWLVRNAAGSSAEQICSLAELLNDPSLRARPDNLSH